MEQVVRAIEHSGSGEQAVILGRASTASRAARRVLLQVEELK